MFGKIYFNLFNEPFSIAHTLYWELGNQAGFSLLFVYYVPLIEVKSLFPNIVIYLVSTWIASYFNTNKT